MCMGTVGLEERSSQERPAQAGELEPLQSSPGFYLDDAACPFRPRLASSSRLARTDTADESSLGAPYADVIDPAAVGDSVFGDLGCEEQVERLDFANPLGNKLACEPLPEFLLVLAKSDRSKAGERRGFGRQLSCRARQASAEDLLRRLTEPSSCAPSRLSW
jgi:hypothetical protein